MPEDDRGYVMDPVTIAFPGIKELKDILSIPTLAIVEFISTCG
jgi:hypothetical protein